MRWRAGWWGGAQAIESPNRDPRPEGSAVVMAIIHSISLPPGKYRGSAVERLFTNLLDWTEHPYFETIRGLRVSSHFFVRRGGRILQFVSCDERAWHAGRSWWQGRQDCNDFSLGIELEGLEGGNFTAAQYRALARLLCAVARRYPVRDVVGHEHVAPGRKRDPGPGFEWHRLREALGSLAVRLPLGD